MDKEFANRMVRCRRPASAEKDNVSYHLCFSSYTHNPEEVREWHLQWLSHPEGGVEFESNIATKNIDSKRNVAVMFDARNIHNDFKERAVEWNFNKKGLALVRTGPSQKPALEQKKKQNRQKYLLATYSAPEDDAFAKLAREKIIPCPTQLELALDVEDLPLVIQELSQAPHSDSPKAREILANAEKVYELLKT